MTPVSTPDSEERRPRPGSGPLRQLLVVLVSAAVVSAIAATAVVLAAAASGSWPPSIGVGVAALVLAGLGWARAARRRWDRRCAEQGARPLLARAGQGPLALVAAAGVLSTSWSVPRTPEAMPAVPVEVQWLDRPDGSRLAVHVTRAAQPRRPPVVFVHGGPGVADMATDAAALAGLATDRDVWVYDQIGTGASTRLDDVTGYTTERAVEDLAAVRRATGAARVVLLGHSWGARTVTVYLARHPDEVEAAVLSAPGQTPVGQEPVLGDPAARLSGTQRARLYAQVMAPRNLFTYLLTAADPRVAHRAAGDREMDARFAGIYGRTRPALFCDPALAGLASTDGVGFYAAYVPQLHPDRTVVPPAAVAGLTVPVLVIRPECDYIPAEMTDSNVRALPTARRVVLPDAGHQAYLERPAAYLQLVTSFLASATPATE
jgi:pimeloyl-ACP methyl ester carboxylesterase